MFDQPCVITYHPRSGLLVGQAVSGFMLLPKPKCAEQPFGPLPLPALKIKRRCLRLWQTTSECPEEEAVYWLIRCALNYRTQYIPERPDLGPTPSS